ncbi:hypothetical protein M3Y99_00219100 [Aphelenchoides fujianensis]|nr:hypothetical protein M3Y99_00219100 [Aphelenchoides fujianensis]
MEEAAVRPKPQMRAAVRDGLNRFQLVDAMNREPKNGATKLARLARAARGVKFARDSFNWRLMLNLGIGAPKVEFPATQTGMREIAKLLDVPIHVDLGATYRSYTGAACKELKGIENLVNGLTIAYFPPSLAFAKFVGRVAPRLKQLEYPSFVLERFPPLDLEKLVLVDEKVYYAPLGRHKVCRLDVPIWEIGRKFTSGRVLSASITSFGLKGNNVLFIHCKAINAFCRRFSALEEFHISALDEHFKKLWAKCLELRDQLNVSGLKRFFFTFEHDCNFFTCKNSDWIAKLKQVEPFDAAPFTVDRSSNLVRMFLKHSRPRDAKPVFFHITGDFRWRDH